MRVALLYGVMEGKRTGAKMVNELKKRGHDVVKSPGDADIIIAHSGGCLEAKEYPANQLLIDPPFDLAGSFWRNFLRHIWFDISHVLPKYPLWYVEKTLRNFSYGLIDISRIMRLYHTGKRLRSFAVPPHAVLVVTNDTAWRKGTELPASAVHFAVSHDDCWRNPGKYLDLMNL